MSVRCVARYFEQRKNRAVFRRRRSEIPSGALITIGGFDVGDISSDRHSPDIDVAVVEASENELDTVSIEEADV